MSRKRTVRPAEIFLSHSSKNVRFTNRLANALAAHGLNSFFSKKNIRGAQEWHDEIGAALKRCDWFLLVLSPDSVRSTWVRRELVYALQEDRLEERIIPVLYKTCDAGELSWTLPALQRIDFRRDFIKRVRNCLRSGGWTHFEALGDVKAKMAHRDLSGSSSKASAGAASPRTGGRETP